MNRGRPREYENRYPLTASVEKDLWDYAQEYGIMARDALSYGLQGLIETEIIKTKKASPEDIDRYLTIKNREMQYIVSVRDKEQQTLNEISKLRDEAKSHQKHNTVDQDPEINWSKIPEEQKIKVYIQQIFTRDEREYWIAELVLAEEDDKQAVLTRFCEEFISRFKRDDSRPFSKVDANEIKRVLVAWAEAEGGV